jgi:site-specific recombinase XerD
MDERDINTNEKINRMIERISNDELKYNIIEYTNALRLGIGCKKSKPRSIEGAINSLNKYHKIINKTLINCDKIDFVNFISELSKEGLKQTTIDTYGIWVRQYYIWLHREKGLINENEYPKIVSWFKPTKTKKVITQNDLFTPSEIQKVVNIADNDRDKAIISGLYESASRIGEWVWIKIKDIEINENYMQIKVSGKTGTRKVILLSSYLYIHKWLENHPFKNDPNAYLFCSFAHTHYGQRINEASVGRMLKTYTKRAKINKHVHCHLLRHSRLSYLAQKEGMRERDIMLLAGWSSTDMCGTYLHHGQEEVFDKLKQKAGILSVEENINDITERNVNKPITCTRCSNINPASSLFCNCGFCLSLKESMLIEEKKKEATNEAMDKLIQIMSDPLLKEKYELFTKNIQI